MRSCLANSSSTSTELICAKLIPLEGARLDVIGLMSGTSLDGLTVGYVKIESCPEPFVCKFVSGRTFPFPPELKRDLLALAETETVTSKLVARSHRSLGTLARESIIEFLREKSLPKPSLVGFHGQTVYHEPSPSGSTTLQIGDPSPICYELGVPVVSDFRSMDTAAGGQGAPLVPAVDYLKYRSDRLSRAVLNIGGIANVTILPRSCALKEVLGFDVGPGNIIVDALVRKLTNNQSGYDDDGKIASNGSPSQELLDTIVGLDDFRALPIPKTTGRERYGAKFVGDILSKGESLRLPMRDLVATSAYYTVLMINHHLKAVRENWTKIQEVIVGGGGSRNEFMMNALRRENPGTKISLHDEYGVPSQFWESYAFAVLAYLSYNGYSGNVPKATGASSQVQLGRINFPAKTQLK